MMRIAYICADPGVPVFGMKGSSVHVQEILRTFLARGDEVTVYCTRRGDTVPDDLRGVRVAEFPVPAGTPAERERAIARIAATLARTAVADGCDLVYERFSLFSRGSAIVARLAGVPVILEVNSPLIEEQRIHRTLVDARIAESAAREVLAAATVVSCVSAPVAEWARRRGAKHPMVVPNGVNTLRIVPAPKLDQVFTVGFVGTLKPWHGVEVLIDAAARLRHRGCEVRVVIVGDGPVGEPLRRLAAALGLDIRFVGAVAPQRMPELLAEWDVGVAPYPDQFSEDYFSPLKVYEYLAAGLPVVASAVGQIPSILDHGVTGLVVPPGDPEALASALEDLCSDRATRERMGRAARAVAVERHDWSRVLDRVLAALPAEGAVRRTGGVA